MDEISWANSFKPPGWYTGGRTLSEQFPNDHHRLPPDWPGTLNELGEIFEAPYEEATLVKLGTSTIAIDHLSWSISSSRRETGAAFLSAGSNGWIEQLDRTAGSNGWIERSRCKLNSRDR